MFAIEIDMREFAHSSVMKPRVAAAAKRDSDFAG